VEEREEKDELRIAVVDLTGQPEPRPRHRLPVLLAMSTRLGVRRSGDDELGKRGIHLESLGRAERPVLARGQRSGCTRSEISVHPDAATWGFRERLR